MTSLRGPLFVFSLVLWTFPSQLKFVPFDDNHVGSCYCLGMKYPPKAHVWNLKPCWWICLLWGYWTLRALIWPIDWCTHEWICNLTILEGVINQRKGTRSEDAGHQRPWRLCLLSALSYYLGSFLTDTSWQLCHTLLGDTLPLYWPTTMGPATATKNHKTKDSKKVAVLKVNSTMKENLIKNAKKNTGDITWRYRENLDHRTIRAKCPFKR